MTEHAGDLLSALVDGRLGGADATRLRAHVDSCADCARELDDVRAARRLVRELPAVEPPAGFLDRMLAIDDVVVPLAPRQRRRLALGGTGAAAAVAAGVALFVVVADPTATSMIEPDVEVAIEQHASTVEALEDDGVLERSPNRLVALEPAPPTTAERQALSDVDEVFDAPASVAGYELVEAYRVSDGVHLLYRKGGYGLSVFEQRGEIDWDDLPSGGTLLTIDGHRAWRSDDAADGRLLVIEDDDIVLTIASDEGGDVVIDVARRLVG